MIEIIFLVTALLTAKEVVPDAPEAKPETAIATPAPEEPPVVSAPVTEETVVTESQPESAPAAPRSPLHRVANDFTPEKDPDLTAAARLTESPDDEPPAGAFGLQFVRSEERFASQGNQVKVEILRPDNDEKRPAILILHGASGIGDGTFYRGAAEIFAERGYVTFMPHYLAAVPARTSQPKAAAKTKTAAKKPAAKDPTPHGDIRAGFTVQQQILLDTLEEIARNPYVDASRIGVFGMSLGGFHALNLSSRDYRVAAVVSMGGALRGNNMPESNRIAPVLALHGAKDSVVPVGRARRLARELKQHGITHDLVVYPDQGHFFRGKARQDAFQRSTSFFSTHLDRPQGGSTTARSATPARD